MKRQVSRRDHIAKDLRTPKYRQRVVPDKKKDERPSIFLDDIEIGYEPYRNDE
jgi:hypothetical protein